MRLPLLRHTATLPLADIRFYFVKNSTAHLHWRLQVFPFLPELKCRLAEVPKVEPSMKSMVEVLEFVAVVLLQDAVELLAEGRFTEHPVHEYLMENPEFA
jgi:hypothetical protein